VITYESRLVGREYVAEDTMAFHFSKPSGYSYHAGQWSLIELIDPPETDEAGDARTFTIASAPHDAELMIAARMRDTAFKRVLREAPLGTPVRLGEADGELVLHEDASRPAVFLAGGIGITPFLSIIRHATHHALPHSLHLFYSNWRPELAAFLSELQGMQRTNPNYRLVATMTEAEKSAQAWSGERGAITRELLERHLIDPTEPIYYLAGPPAMTIAMLDMLSDLGVADDAIQSEEFYGY